MIRRDDNSHAQQPAWVLISQVKHAHLSAALAADWQHAELPFAEQPEERHELLAAIRHHDDGWSEWEARPEVDKEGRPYDFAELPRATAVAIWSQSIAAAAKHGPLAGSMVAGHFLWLHQHKNADEPVDQQWFDATTQQRQAWLEEWIAADASHTAELAEACVGWLRWFDLLSLALCCRETTKPREVEIPDTASLHLAPQPLSEIISGGAPVVGQRFALDRWPFEREDDDDNRHVEPRVYTLQAVSVPIHEYADDAALAAAERTEATMRWEFVHHG